MHGTADPSIKGIGFEEFINGFGRVRSDVNSTRLNKFQEVWYRNSRQYWSIQQSLATFIIFGMLAGYGAALIPLFWLLDDPRLHPDIMWYGKEQWVRIVTVTFVGVTIGNLIPLLLLFFGTRKVKHLGRLMRQVISVDHTVSRVVTDTFEAADMRFFIGGLVPVDEVSVGINAVLLALPSVLFLCLGRW